MQKLDFVKNLETIVDKLQSKQITEKFKQGFAQPGQAYQYELINPFLFASKSNYDQIKTNEKYSKILESLGAQSIYTEQYLSSLTTIFRTVAANSIIPQVTAVAFYNFHNTLVSTLKLSKDVLMSKILENGFEASIDNGVVVFQILIEGEGLATEKYIKILSAFQDLIQTISKVLNEEEQKPEIILLDSGSDTNIGIKSGIETAKSLFLIFKEIWDFITNHKYYKQAQNNKALLDSLSIREEIKKKVDSGVLTEDEGKEYNHIIKSRTDELIGMKVLPKQIVLETNQIENKKLLSEFEGLKMLKGGE